MRLFDLIKADDREVSVLFLRKDLGDTPRTIGKHPTLIAQRRRMVRIRRSCDNMGSTSALTYPGGLPNNLATEPSVLSSWQLMRTKASRLPNTVSASALTVSVLPTPVGPSRSIVKIGRS